MSDAHDLLAGLDSARLAQLAEREQRQPARPRPADQHPDLPVGFVKQAQGLGYFVKSRSTEGAWWLVAGRTCSCPAGQAGRERCWHRSQVEAFCRKLDAELDADRPPAKPAPASWFVD